MNNRQPGCTACGKIARTYAPHELLGVPICEKCWKKLRGRRHDQTNYCKWCGETDTESELCLCDSCPNSFCSGCIERNFGLEEIIRIQNLSGRWLCFICTPQSIEDLAERISPSYGSSFSNNAYSKSITNNRLPKHVICGDISRGREKHEIRVFNDVDDEPAPLDFTYVTKHVSGEGASISNNPNFISCCDCQDNCKDPTKCACAKLMDGFAYDRNGTLMKDKPRGVYECNQRCSCHKQLCKNRVVGNGPKLRLEVFRCEDPHKGWGVRCLDGIPTGTFIADYIGEILA